MSDEQTNANLILLFSGGLDSRLLLQMALESNVYRPFCIVFNYGQRHHQEIEKAEQVCKIKGVPYMVIKLELPNTRSVLTTGEKHLYPGVSEWHVPARNLMFVSVAASIAESMKISTIWYGANYADRMNRFPDCYQEWIFITNQLLQINGSMSITLEAPLLGMQKSLIESLATLYNIKKEEVFSGYGE